MPHFTKKFGVYDAKMESYVISASLESAGSSIPTAGLFIGSMMCHLISDRFGRRAAILFTTIIYIIAISIEVTANSFWQIVVGCDTTDRTSFVHPAKRNTCRERTSLGQAP